MTENTTPENQEFKELDIFLATFMNFLRIKREGMEVSFSIPITLNIKGLIVTGELIDLTDYIRGIIQEMESATYASEISRMYGSAYTRVFSEILTDDLNSTEDIDLVPPRYIHLKNAKYFVGNRLVPTNRGVYWRGRLDQVDGFNLGNISSD
jgi:hypothetical protein